MTRLAIELAESEEEEEPDGVVVDGILWRTALSSEETYRTLRGPIRVRRKLYGDRRDRPTRCFFEERRGVLPGRLMPGLGRAIVEAVAELFAERAKLERVTGQELSSTTMKRTATAVGNALRDEEALFLKEHVRHRAVPGEARAVVVSVDALSFNLRGEGYNQATAATISLLDEMGERLATTKLAEHVRHRRDRAARGWWAHRL